MPCMLISIIARAILKSETVSWHFALLCLKSVADFNSAADFNRIVNNWLASQIAVKVQFVTNGYNGDDHFAFITAHKELNSLQ